MKIYEKNRWFVKNENIDLRYFFGKNKLKLLNKGFFEMEKKGYKFGVKKMGLEDLNEFYSIYKKFIEEKNNARVFPLIERYKDRIKNKDEIYFGYLRDENGNLLGGGLFIYKYDDNLKEKISITGYRAYNKDIIVEKLKLGYYIEFLFFKWSLEDLKVGILSRGVDRNVYGFLGSNTGLPIHKLQFKFLPYKRGEEFEFNEKEIDKESLIFTDSNKEGLYTKAIIYTNLKDEEVKDKYSLIEKRGINLIIKKY